MTITMTSQQRKVLILGHSKLTKFLRKELLIAQETSNFSASEKFAIVTASEIALVNNVNNYDFIVVAAYNNLDGTGQLEHHLFLLPKSFLVQKKVRQVLLATENTSMLGHESMERHLLKWPIPINYMYKEIELSVETNVKILCQAIRNS